MVRHKVNLQDPKDHKLILILVALLLIFGVMAAYIGIKYFVPSGTKITAKSKTAIEKTTDKTQLKSKKAKKHKKIQEATTDEQKIAVIDEKVTTEKITEKAAPGKTVESIEKTTEIIEESTADKKVDTIQEIADKTSLLLNMPKKKLGPTDSLDQMPDRKNPVTSPFASSKAGEVVVAETDYAVLKEEASSSAGKYDPFAPGDINALMGTKKPGATKSDGYLPDVPNLPPKITLPPDIENLSSVFSKFNKASGKPGTTQQNVPQEPSIVTNTPPANNLLDNTILTGVIDQSAILNFGGVSRALHAGQNYQGIVVLSVTPRAVVLKSNGVKVRKELRD